MKTITENIRQYVDAWNTKDEEEVLAGFQQCLSPGCTYNDKNTPTVTGLQSITDLVMDSYKKFPGREFSLTSEPECFDNKGRYYWRVTIPGQGEKNCMDFIEFDADNKITHIVGFV